MDIAKQVARKLNKVLPLSARQSSLEPNLIKLHQFILQNFSQCGCPPSSEQMQKYYQPLPEALQQLRQLDLIVMQGTEICGAYPFSKQATDHQLKIKNHSLYAICAFDAVGIASAFNTTVYIKSKCAQTGKEINLQLKNKEIIKSNPNSVLIGIHWKNVSGCAANSLCHGMVFLFDESAADSWRSACCSATRSDTSNLDVLSLPEAINASGEYFSDLLTNEH